MNPNRMILGVGIAVLVALLFSIFVYRQFNRLTNVKTPETAHIVVAEQPIPLGTRLDANNLQTIAWPANQPIAGSFSRIEDCVGRAAITNMAVNEPVLEDKLAPKEAGAGLPATIPEGMRALSVA